MSRRLLASESLADSTRGIRGSLCEWAVANPDGTYTIVRGGIDHWDTDLPLNTRSFGPSLWLFLDMEPGALGIGEHDLRITFTLPNGASALAVGGRVTVTNPQASTRIALPLEVSVQSYGLCRVHCLIAALDLTLQLDVRPKVGKQN